MTAGTAFIEVWGAVLLALLLLVAFVITVKRLQQRRRARAAAALGLAGVPRAKPFTDDEAAGSALLHLFNMRAQPGGAQPGVLRGTLGGVETAIFDYDFTLKSGFHTSTETAHQTVAALRSAPPEAEFLLTARRKRDWATPEPGKASFDFHPDFARRYRVETRQPEALRRLLTGEKLVFLARLAEKESWTIWCADGWFILYRQERMVASRKLGRFLEDAQAIVATLQPPPAPGA
ncbi:MAG: hypothetical protein M3P27_03595 [Acidobacteriota bacterium]|nr:hypothetical protein [Acidobacteriota bacterium]